LIQKAGLTYLAKIVFRSLSFPLFLASLLAYKVNPFNYAFDEALIVGKYLAHLIANE
jgi:predicted PurR-regulated permease PerM